MYSMQMYRRNRLRGFCEVSCAAALLAAGAVNTIAATGPPSGLPPSGREDCNSNGVEDDQDLAAWGTAFDDASSWAAFDPGSHGVGIDPDGYWGGAFDGRYVYFAPYKNGTSAHGEVMRLDTTAEFGTVGAWVTYDPGSHGVGTDPDGYIEAIFDGRYVYFVPDDNGTAAHGEVLRLDTQGDFLDTAAWAAFDAGAHGVGTDPDGYNGGVFDGRYIYFAPYDNGTVHHSEVMRYDTRAGFEDAASWATFDPRPHGVNQDYGYCGAVYDGQYVYFVPNCRSDTYHHGEVLRYDTNGGFEDPAAWKAFDPGDHGVGTKPDGYVGGIYDGQYIYFIPCYKEPYGWHGEVMRYNTAAAFDDVAAWDTFDPGANGVGTDPDGFVNGFFDGRFIYFVPAMNGASYSGEAMRYDTTGDFSDVDSWITFDPGAHGVGSIAEGFSSGAFDGRYVYFSPTRWAVPHGEFMRYDIAAVGSPDCNGNSVPDECDLDDQTSSDCNGNSVPDECDIAHGLASDCNANDVPDDCDLNDWGTAFSEASSWAAFDAGDHGVGDDPDGYDGAVFDGRYVYFVPYMQSLNLYHDEVMRFDTLGDLADPSSWATFDPGENGVGSAYAGFVGGILIGHYIYFVPYGIGGSKHGQVLRYDIHGEFADITSWAAYDAGANGVGTDPDGYCGAASDGRYIYFAPSNNGTAYHGEVLRFDTAGDFSQAASWAAYDPGENGVGVDPDGYSGAVCDGRYVYFTPNYNGTSHHGEVLRHDTLGDFADPASWVTYDPGSHGVGSDPDGFHGGVFDGRYVYFVPYNDGTTYCGEAMRFDTTGDFFDTAAWETFDAGANGVGDSPDGFHGAVFDGRFVYFVPNYKNSGNNGEVMRYDTAGGFTEVDSWITFEPADEGVGIRRGYHGGCFDGRFLYLAPAGWQPAHGEVMRYDIVAIGAADCNGNGEPDECDIDAGIAEDCNSNSVPDECDIASGFSWDVDDNGIPDECEDDCPADVNDDLTVNIDDLFAILAAWGPCSGCPEDLNGDGTVNIDDLFAVLAQWGPCS